jgi:hypothetical protein
VRRRKQVGRLLEGEYGAERGKMKERWPASSAVNVQRRRAARQVDCNAETQFGDQ